MPALQLRGFVSNSHAHLPVLCDLRAKFYDFKQLRRFEFWNRWELGELFTVFVICLKLSPNLVKETLDNPLK